MNAWKNHRFSFMLAASSLLLLLLFQVFWLSNTYQKEKENLKEKADLAFEGAVRSIEDSLFNLMFFEKIDIHAYSAAHTKVKVRKTGEWKSNDLEAHLDQNEFKKEIRIFEADSSVDLKVDLRSDFKFSPEGKHFGSIAFMLAGDSLNEFLPDTSLAGYNNFELLEKKLKKQIPNSGLPTPFEVIQLEEDKLPAVGFFSNPHTDFVSGKSYAIFFPNYRGFLLQKILPQILFSVFLFGAILFSFFMVWQSLEKQRRLTELKNDFISNVTHELKTPITTVGVALEALSNFNALKNPERTEEYINISKHELQRLSLLVDKVLKMSLFEKKEPELKLEMFDMQTLIQGVLRSMKLQFEKFSADVNFDFEGSEFSIKGDKIHLTNVIYNLIDNALKYSKEKPVINLLLKKENGRIQLTVKDQGIGISTDLKDKIFEKFFRVPQGDQHDIKGYGLGLSYVSGVIKKHRGNIHVDSQIKQGTSFTISLPESYE